MVPLSRLVNLLLVTTLEVSTVRHQVSEWMIVEHYGFEKGYVCLRIGLSKSQFCERPMNPHILYTLLAPRCT